MTRALTFLLATLPFLSAALAAADNSRPLDAKPIARVQAVPQRYSQVPFQRDDKEIACYYLSPALNRRDVFSVGGPSGRSLTRRSRSQFFSVKAVLSVRPTQEHLAP